jgi:hypothetical protein
VKDSLTPSAFTENPGKRQEKLQREILTYCVEHPDAKDTLSGILKWWFADSRSRWRSDEVGTALESLAAKDWLTARMIRQSERIYGLNKTKLSEIEIFLGKS